LLAAAALLDNIIFFAVPSFVPTQLSQFYPKGKPENDGVNLRFRSGLRLYLSAGPPRELVNTLSSETGVSPQALELAFARDTMKSDYDFVKAVVRV